MGSPQKQAAAEGDQAFLANDKLFLWRVHWINHTERQAGELAKSQGKAEGVPDYGRRLAEDHARNEQKLLSLAKKKDIRLQLTRDEYQKVRDQLAKQMTMQMDLVHEDEESFDREFLTHMVDDHVAAINLVRAYREKAKDADLRSFIDETLTMLEEHHEIAVSLRTKLGSERQDVKGQEDEEGSPSTLPRELPRYDKPEEGVDRQEELQQDLEKRTRPPADTEERVVPPM